MSDKWYVLLSDLQDGDVEKLIEATGGDASIYSDETCFGVSGHLYDFFWAHDYMAEYGYTRLTREQAFEKMGIEV